MLPILKMKKKHILLIVSLFILILTGARLLWLQAFHQLEHPVATQGKLDLREWDKLEDSTILLDGEWEFYPNQWLLGQDGEEESLEESHFIQVPGGWNTYMQSENNRPFGYGSYRLRIHVDPSSESIYSAWIPSVRSASELYINGRLMAKSGETGESKEAYVAENNPYSATFTADEAGVIEIVVQAANFKDPRDSGIIRSIQFGLAEMVSQETGVSMLMQQLVAIVFLIHAIYAVILFYVSNHNKQFLVYFSIFMGSMTFSILLGSDNKLLHYWLPINYEWGFKLVHLFFTGLAFSALQLIRSQVTGFWKRLIRWGIALIIVAALLALLLPATYILIIQPLYFILLGISILVAIGILLHLSIKDGKDNILLLLSIIALTNGLVWWGYFGITGVKIVYYPFDLIIAMICFASIWFKRYSQAHVETEELAIELQKEHKLKDDFLANTSHELRNPLHSILNILKAVTEREKASLNEVSIKDLDTVQDIGRHMSLTLDDLLEAMSLKDGENRQLRLRNISIPSIVTGVIDMLQYMIEGRPVQFKNKIPEQLSPVYADENRVIQIIFNLLHNAVKYTNEGTVSIAGYIKDEQVEIVISDTGIGMDKVTLSHIFKPYKQGDHGQGGIGLGVTISKQLIEWQGGTLQASSVLGKGSEFKFTLPLATEKEAEEMISYPPAEFIESALAATSTIESSLSNENGRLKRDRPRLLIVDDEYINLKVIKMILSTEEYQMTGVTSGHEALDLLDSQEWDLIISDVMMPHMSGYELTRTIREHYTMTELPILLLTARGQSEDIKRGFLSGANDYVTKPVDPIEIRSRVKVLTEVKRSAREQLQMEAAWLQAQIQPHFLFNTLNAITALSEIDLEKMHVLIDEFTKFLRNKFQFQIEDELKPIEEELSVVRSYLYIQQVRFNERLQVIWDIDDCSDVKIPLLTIQPLVENALEHGIMKRVQGGTITIRISNDEDEVKIVVEDDGVGMDASTLHRILDRDYCDGSGIGLINTDLRLKRQFGKGLEITSKLDVGTSVSFIVRKK